MRLKEKKGQVKRGKNKISEGIQDLFLYLRFILIISLFCSSCLPPSLPPSISFLPSFFHFPPPFLPPSLLCGYPLPSPGEVLEWCIVPYGRLSRPATASSSFVMGRRNGVFMAFERVLLFILCACRRGSGGRVSVG